MKNRNGFVSNSSSSSFIVSAPRGLIPTAVIEIELPVDETISSVKELDKYYVENYCNDGQTLDDLLNGDEGEYYKEEYETCVKEIEKGNAIHFGTVCSDGDDVESNFLNDKGIGDTLKKGIVIQDCGN